MSFHTLGLSEPILRAIADAGYTQPTPIQTQAIPAVLSGKDLLAGAQTGTGKTAGFVLPILQRLSQTTRPLLGGKSPIRVLILTPTRELTAQVEESVRIYGKHLDFKSAVIFGGVGANPQIATLKRGVDILVATPGRLLDLQQQGHCNLSQVEIFVLDEADRMLDMGFIHDIKKVLAILPQQANGQRRQNLLFSATFSDDIKALADRLLNNPTLIEVARRNTTAQTIAQKLHFVNRDQKQTLLAHLIKQGNWHQVLVFARTKHGANKVAEKLADDGISAMAIHGNKSQTARTKALSQFKAGELQVLVATDIAARGIDIDQLAHVINYDLPNVPEDYVHRIGRTGRAGASGEAISFVTVDETNFLADIEKLIKKTIHREVIIGFEADMSIPAEPISTGRQTLWGAPKPAGWKPAPKTNSANRNPVKVNHAKAGQPTVNPAHPQKTSANQGRNRHGATPVGNSSANQSGRARPNTAKPQVATAPVNGHRHGASPHAAAKKTTQNTQSAKSGRQAQAKQAANKPAKQGWGNPGHVSTRGNQR